MTSFNPGWYLIYTMPHHEKKVHSRLSELGIDSLLPTRKMLKKLCDRKKIIDEVLFPSYVFVYLKDLANYFEGMGILGSLCYVKMGRQLVRVNETVVGNIKLITTQALDLEVTDVRYQPGQRLVIGHGALTGLSCEVIESNSKRSLLIRVELLQRSILLKMPEENLIAV